MIFYNTNIFKIHTVAKHIYNLNIDSRLEDNDLTLVNEIAKIDFNGKIKNMYSFATKYCSHHKPDIFPIYDSYVEKVLKYYHMINEDLQFKNSDLKDYQSYVNIFSQS